MRPNPSLLGRFSFITSVLVRTFKRSPLFMLQAIVDETESNADPRIFVIGGYIASDLQWAKLSDAWKAALEQPRPLEHYKYSEAYPLSSKPKGQFHRWTPEERDHRVALLRGLIEEHAQAEIVVGFGRDAYERAFGDIRKMG